MKNYRFEKNHDLKNKVVILKKLINFILIHFCIQVNFFTDCLLFVLVFTTMHLVEDSVTNFIMAGWFASGSWHAYRLLEPMVIIMLDRTI